MVAGRSPLSRQLQHAPGQVHLAAWHDRVQGGTERNQPFAAIRFNVVWHLVIVCWAVFGFLLLLFWMPALLARLGATRFTYSGPTNVPEEDPLEKEPDYHFWSAQLHALGYEMVGDLRLQTRAVAIAVGFRPRSRAEVRSMEAGRTRHRRLG